MASIARRTTIIDSNVTNLITGIVIYKIAPDNVKGFGVTLVLGIAMSIFVAVFLTRIVFDVAERRRWIKTLRMRQFIGETNFDFLGWRRVCIARLAAGDRRRPAGRRRPRRGDLLDIDFTGGSSVQLVLEDDQKMDFDEVMDVLQQHAAWRDKNLSLVEIGKTRHALHGDDGQRRRRREVEQILTEAFQGQAEDLRRRSDRRDADCRRATAPTGSRTRRERCRRPLVLEPSAADFVRQPAASGAGGRSRAATPMRRQATTRTPIRRRSCGRRTPTPKRRRRTKLRRAAADDDAARGGRRRQLPSAAARTPMREAATAVADPFAGGTAATIKFGTSTQATPMQLTPTGGVSYDAMEQLLLDALKATGHEGAAYRDLQSRTTARQHARNFAEWNVKLALPPDRGRASVRRASKARSNGKPVFPLSNKIGGRVADADGGRRDRGDRPLPRGHHRLRVVPVPRRHLRRRGRGGADSRRARRAGRRGAVGVPRRSRRAAGQRADDRQVPDQPDAGGGVPDDHRLLAQRHDRHLRPHPRGEGQEPAAHRAR